MSEIVVAPQENLFHAAPVEVIRQAYAISKPLATALQGAKLVSVIDGRQFVRVEGWTMLGSMLGVFPIVVWTRRVTIDTDHDGWEARVEARTRDGAIVGAGEAQCTRDEVLWGGGVTKRGKRVEPREDYALRAMAQTRATSRALRGPLGFVVALAGFEATAAEEMPRDE